MRHEHKKVGAKPQEGEKREKGTIEKEGEKGGEMCHK